MRSKLIESKITGTIIVECNEDQEVKKAKLTFYYAIKSSRSHIFRAKTQFKNFMLHLNQ